MLQSISMTPKTDNTEGWKKPVKTFNTQLAKTASSKKSAVPFDIKKIHIINLDGTLFKPPVIPVVERKKIINTLPNMDIHLSKSIAPKLPARPTPEEISKVNIDKTLHELKDVVKKALRERRTFIIYGYYDSIRNALLARDWIESVAAGTHINSGKDALLKSLSLWNESELVAGMQNPNIASYCKKVILSKLLESETVALIWNMAQKYYLASLKQYKSTLINMVIKHTFSFANKNGLVESIKEAHWYCIPGTSSLQMPRSHALRHTDDPLEFVQDFRITSAMSLLKWIIHRFEFEKSKLISNSGSMRIASLFFALEECEKFLSKIEHENLDKAIYPASDVEWEGFLEQYHKATIQESHFKETTIETECSLVKKSKDMLTRLRKKWKFLDMDGFMNIWIVKPSCGSRGMGIHFCTTVESVLDILKENSEKLYIVQKYIERPLLIHNRKFDIRQWFLISSTKPLTIWIWKECYIRFSSQTYNLRKLHESIHLTNYSIQKKYETNKKNIHIPSYNMWHLHELKQYLRICGKATIFEEVIYPGIKECITAAILSHFDHIYGNPYNFELCGADFMITEDYCPWLIEINSKPALNPSTPVTTELVPRVLEDVIKVVIDHQRDPGMPTGNFELLYKVHNATANYAAELEVKGKALFPKANRSSEEGSKDK